MSNTVIKGYPSNNKLTPSRDLKYANVEPVSLQKDGLAIRAYQFARVVGADAAEANSTADVIVATAHAALVGDVISFTSGANSGLEFMVTAIDVNSITTSELMPAAPGVGDTFDILRNKTPIVSAAGGSTVTVAGPTGTQLGVYAEDSAHVSGDTGILPLAVRQDAAGPMAADGDYTPLQTNANGELKVAATFTEQAVYAEDSAHASGDILKAMGAVRNDASAAFTGADGDYSPVAVDSAGRIKNVVESIVPGVGATNLGKAEDAAHTSGDVGVMALAVRQDATAALAADGDYTPLQTDANGLLKVSSVEQAIFAEDSAHTTGDNGKFVLGVRNDASAALTGADGDYSALAVDSAGRQKSVIESLIPGVTATALGKAEDAAHASGDTGVMGLAVRNDAGTALAGTDGDYIPLSTDAAGNLWSTVAGVVPGVAATSLGKAEDAAHTTGDVGVMGLAVRNDAGAALAGTDGDYIPLSTNATGKLWSTVDGVIPGVAATSLGKAEDAAHTTGDTGVMALGVRSDAGTSFGGTDGDYVPMSMTSLGDTRIMQMNSIVPFRYDYIGVAYPDADTETYTYRTGGSGGTIVATVTVNYTDATKANVADVTRT